MSDSNKTIEQELFEIVQTLFLNENKQFVAAQIASRFKTAAEHHRYDRTINQVAFVLEKVAEQNPTMEISESDLVDLANKFYSPDTEFYNEFSDLFNSQEQQNQAKQASRIDFESETKHLAWDSSYEKESGNPYSNDDSIIDSSISYTPEDLALVREASMLIDEQFKNTGKVYKTSSVLKQVEDGLLIFQTKIKTASREAEVFVPVELKDSIPLFPEIMGTIEKGYEITTAGLEQFASDLEIEESLRKSQNQALFRSAEDFEIALRNDTMGAYSEEVSEDEDFVADQNRPASLLDSEIEQVLVAAVKAKTSKYSNLAREEASRLIKATLKENKLNPSSVEFETDTEYVMIYKANLNTELGQLKTKIAVEVQNSIILPPTSLEFEGETIAISQEDLLKTARSKDELVVVSEFDPLMMSMSYPELKKQLRQSAYKKKHKVAQKIINLIEEKFGSYYGNAAIDDYQTWLEESTGSTESQCGGCDHFVPKTSQAQNDYCNLIKTAAKNVKKDASGICVRSTYAGDEESVFLDAGNLIQIKLD